MHSQPSTFAPVDVIPNNDPVIEAWNTVLFDKFCRFEDILVNGLGRHGTELFRIHPPAEGARVLDVGCGFGDTSIQLAEAVGEDGRVFAIDCAQNFVRAAQTRAKAAASRNLEVLCADVQLDALPRGCDAVYSRFGTMFFSSPVAALRNLRRSLKPGGTLAMSVWRRRQDNPCFYIAQQVVERFVAPEDKNTDAITCGPGPFSMASADLVSELLLAAGFETPTLQRFDAPMCVGRNLDEAVSFAREIGPAGEAIRLASEKAGLHQTEIDAALREAFAPYLHDDGVWATSSTWLVTATAPSSGSAH